ncbi:MAG TPA: DNA-processing protein DprA [Steroidobacteraceae bacterium]|nr:DNA-processing protein DprA [Steroidobacteraceae bacterium]
MDAVTARVVLARAPGLTAAHVHALMAAVDSDIERVLDAGSLARIELPAHTRAFLEQPDRSAVLQDCHWLAASGAQLLLSTDALYPLQLAGAPDPPAALFVLGDPRTLREPQLAMVGSRNPTPCGRRTAREFAASFARAGLTITSGLAIGIDAACHEGALQGGGKTIAVCATGLERVYPAQHGGLAERIRERGALVSEFAPSTALRRANFPRRNRLISGLAVGTLVVEAAQRSGSLITARHAADQGREVFAIPGSIYSPLSRGCHKLIRDGATLVQEPAELLAELRIPLKEEALVEGSRPSGAGSALDKGFEMLLDAVDFEPATVDVLAARTGLAGEVITPMLLMLELEGRIASCAGGRYGRLP